MSYTVPHLINGIKIPDTGRDLLILNPAIGEPAGKCFVADSSIVNQAVTAATNALPAWSQKPAAQRGKIIQKFKILLDENKEALAEHVTREHGKTTVEAIGSVQRGIDVVDYACGIANLLKGDYTDNVASGGIDSYSLRQPLGVCVGITPFNFPAMIPLWMFPMSIACGNTFILKPSEKNPSCALHIAELAMIAGVPEGVINVVHGDKETVDALITHQGVSAVSFVGSSVVAKHVYETAILHGKRAQAFGGAKNHAVIMPDADLDQAVNGILLSAYGSSGERCMAISVVVCVGDQTADAFVTAISPKVKALRVGAGTENNIDMGPLITKMHLEKVTAYVNAGIKEGATLVVDGRETSQNTGYYMGGCLFDHVAPHMSIHQDEIFGPVLCVMRAKNLEDALSIINHHTYANGTAIFTRDGYTGKVFAERVMVGMVGINVPVPVPVPYHSFGGWKASVFADIGMYGPEAIRFNTRLKTITQRWSAKEGAK